MKKLVLLLTAVLTVSCISWAADTTKKKTVVDTTGQQVQVPVNPERLVEMFMGHNEVVAMLGASDRLVGTVYTEKRWPWMYRVCPDFHSAISLSTEYNIEDVMKLKPDVMFTKSSDLKADKVSSLGIPVVKLYFEDFRSMKKCFEITADVLGKDAPKRAQLYNNYFDSKLEEIKKVTDKIPKKKRPKVLQIVSLSPLCVDGGGIYINDWMEVAGGVNAAEELKGGIMQQVSLDQILEWNPDVLILAVNAKHKERNAILSDERWKSIEAVKNKKVFVNPEGAFIWSRAGAELALQIQWAAKTINPKLFENLDIAKETKWFYKTFFDYSLSTDEVQKILNAQLP